MSVETEPPKAPTCSSCEHYTGDVRDWPCCDYYSSDCWTPKPEPDPTSEEVDAAVEHASRERPSFQAIYMNMAHELAKRSTCSRLQVGTVITSVDFRKVLAVGYNGNASGLPNTCDRDEPGNCGCLHSEENAVINCDAPRETPKLVFCTHLPCPMCAKRLINLGNVRTVYYAQDYRKRDAIDLFARAGINVALIGGRK